MHAPLIAYGWTMLSRPTSPKLRRPLWTVCHGSESCRRGGPAPRRRPPPIINIETKKKSFQCLSLMSI